MFFVSPLIIAISLILIIAPITILSLFPIFPRNKIIICLWTSLLAFALGVYIWHYFLAQPNILNIWKTPKWYPIIPGFFFIFVPFTSSALLWKIRKNTPQKISKTLSSITLITIILLSFFCSKTFNKTCIYFDYHNDSGQAWCPKHWKAKL